MVEVDENKQINDSSIQNTLSPYSEPQQTTKDEPVDCDNIKNGISPTTNDEKLQNADDLQSNMDKMKIRALSEEQQPSALTFEDMDLPESILRAIYSLGFSKPSQVQQYAVIPHRNGRDVVIQAQSGTGKTVAFGLGSILCVDPEIKYPQVLVLCHTRELCLQTTAVFESLLKLTPSIGVYALIGGGKGLNVDIMQLDTGKQIIVGTTGRMKHLMEKGILNTSHVKQLVLDEADKMLDNHFIFDVGNITQLIENRRDLQVCLYSATISDRVLDLITKIMRPDHFKFLLPTKKVALEGIKQYKVVAKTLQDKLNITLSIIDDITAGSCIVFCNKKDEARNLYQIMTKNDFVCKLIHGELEQAERESIMEEFRTGQFRHLVATDLIGRGIDVQHVGLVINFGIPNSQDDYIHRVGRSGRFGKKGYAINIINPTEEITLSQFESYYNFKCDFLPKNISELISGI